MQTVQPKIEVFGDREDKIMSRSGELVGFMKEKFVWRFGFMPESDFAKAFGVSTRLFTWVLSTSEGQVLDRYSGFASDLPETFRTVLDSEI